MTGSLKLCGKYKITQNQYTLIYQKDDTIYNISQMLKIFCHVVSADSDSGSCYPISQNPCCRMYCT